MALLIAVATELHNIKGKLAKVIQKIAFQYLIWFISKGEQTSSIKKSQSRGNGNWAIVKHSNFIINYLLVNNEGPPDM